MKKFYLLGIALVLCSCFGTVKAANYQNDIFDFTSWYNDAVLNLFAKCADEGRNYPTKEEFRQLGIALDVEFSRSHVRPGVIMEDASKNVNQEVNPIRRLWMNIPTGQGEAIGGYPSSDFHSDVFSMWNYTNLFGSWNHTLFQAPGSWADAAHKNGTHIFSGIKFFESWGTTSSTYNNMITTKNADGTFKYVDAFLNALMFMGLDGINYNFEDSGYAQADVVAFHQALYKRAKEIGFDTFHIGLYTSSSSLSTRTANALYGTKENGKTADLMLNYSGGDFAAYYMASSAQAAESALGTADGLYAGGWFRHMNLNWPLLNQDEDTKKVGLCLWGEHKISRFFQFVVGNDIMDMQRNYQRLLEKGFSGGNFSPVDRPAPSYNNTFQVGGPAEAETQLASFCGLAEFIPERTAIKGNFPFNTNFNLGNGDFYAYKGKKTHGSWYNMAQQDYVPTYRWLIYKSGTSKVSTDIKAEFTHEDAYIGGSCLRLHGKATQSGDDVILYRTRLTVGDANPVAKLAVKLGVEGENASNLYLILKKYDSSEWLEFPVGNLEGATWQEKVLALSSLTQGDVVEYIGLRVKGSADKYKVLVGQLQLSDDRAGEVPANIDEESVLVDVKQETTKSLTVKMTWGIDETGITAARKQYGMIYNDEANIDHFEVFYKDGAEGRVAEVARTTSWAAVVGNIALESDSEPYIGVRSVSVDQKTFSPIVWTKITRDPAAPQPQAEDHYGKSYLDPTSEGASVAQQYRYIAELKTTGATKDLNFTSTTAVGGENYLRVTDQQLEIAQGQTIKLYFKAAHSSYSDDGLKWCIGKGYMDWNIDYIFDATSDELVFEVGKTNSGTDAIKDGVEFTINVPADATPGLSRLRLVFSDAWFKHPGPTGGTAKGFSIDFDVVITGENEGRKPAESYLDYRDKGTADEPEYNTTGGVEDVVKGDNGVFGEVSSLYPSVVTNVVYFKNVENAWIYTIDGLFVKYATGNPESVNVEDLTPGIYVVKMQNGNVIRNQKIVKK